jgi:two-component system nitrogen regulation response regulator GlnG
VRQLENICHWLTVMAPAQLIEPKDLPPEIAPGQADAVAPAARSAPAAELARVAEPTIVTSSATAAEAAVSNWESGLEAEALALLAAGRHDVWEALTKRFESRLILTALANTRGRRIEAAQKLGIGRNTITRKIQELGLDSN